MTTGLMDVNDVAKVLRVSPHTIRRWASQKKLQKLKLGSRIVFDPADVYRFIEEARAASEAANGCPSSSTGDDASSE